MKLKTEVADEPIIGQQRPSELSEIDVALRPKLAKLEVGKELKVWPPSGRPQNNGDHRWSNFRAMLQRYLKAEWPELRVRENCDADFLRIGHKDLRKRALQKAGGR